MKRFILILFILYSLSMVAIASEIKLEADFLLVNSDSILVVAQKSYQMGEYRSAATAYLEYLKGHIDDAGNIYNLACCYGLLGDSERAVYYLEMSYDRGFKNLEHIKQDLDFAKVKESEKFKELIAKLEAEVEPVTQTREMVSGISYSPYLLKLPTDFDPKAEYPLIVALHGYGHNAPEFSKLFEKVTAIIATPETSYPLDIGGKKGYSWSADIMDEEILEDSFWQSSQTIAQMIYQLKQKYNVSKVMVMGFSQGGGLSYLVGLSHPELVDMIVPFGGFYPEDSITQAMINYSLEKSLKVFIGHGESDEVVIPAGADKAEEALSSAGLSVEKYFYEGGHRIDRETLQKAVNALLQD